MFKNILCIVVFISFIWHAFSGSVKHYCGEDIKAIYYTLSAILDFILLRMVTRL